MLLNLKLVNGEELEQHIDSDSCIIGRSAKCDVVVPHEGMSRQHCQVDLIDGELFITDLGSTNGVLIDGKKIEPNKKCAYQTFLPLSFGAVQSLQIQIEAPAPLESIKVASPIKSAPSSSHKTGGIKPLKDPSRPISVPKAEKENRTKFIAINILLALLLIAVAWWYVQEDEGSVSTPTEESSSSQTINSDQF